jgi:hypothetical protein
MLVFEVGDFACQFAIKVSPICVIFFPDFFALILQLVKAYPFLSRKQIGPRAILTLLSRYIGIVTEGLNGFFVDGD